MKRDASLREIALRAATRPERLRWDPLVCIDERGNLEGIVPMQRIVTGLASDRVESDQGSSPPSELLEPVHH